MNTPTEVNDVALPPEEMFLFRKMPASLIPSPCFRNEIQINFIIITWGHIKFPPVLFGEMRGAQCASGYSSSYFIEQAYHAQLKGIFT